MLAKGILFFLIKIENSSELNDLSQLKLLLQFTINIVHS